MHPGHGSPLLSHETGSVIYPTVSCGPDPEDLKPKDRQEHGLLHSFIFQLPGQGCHRQTHSVLTLKASSSTLIRSRAQPGPPPTLAARRGNTLIVQVSKGNWEKDRQTKRKRNVILISRDAPGDHCWWQWKKWWHLPLSDQNYRKTIVKSTWDLLHSKKVCYSTIPEIDHGAHRLLCKFPEGKLIACLVFNQFPLRKRSGLIPSIPHFILDL